MQPATRILQQWWKDSARSISLQIVNICVLLFVAMMVLDSLHVLDRQQLFRVLGLSFSGIARGRIYQFVTAPFLHADIVHLCFNMLTLWMLGPTLEQALGRGRYVVLSILCAAVSLTSFVWLSADHGSILLGYSSIIFGLIVAQAMLFPNSIIVVFGLFPLKMKYAALLFGAIELSLSQSGAGGGHVAELAGGITAFVFLRVVRRWPARWPLWIARFKSIHLPVLRRPQIYALLKRRRIPQWGSPNVLCPSDACGHTGRAVVTGKAAAAKCQACGAQLPKTDRRTPLPRTVVVLGTPRCGQTSWLMRGFKALRESADQFSFLVENQEDCWRSNEIALNLAKRLPPTPAILPVAWCVEYESNGFHERLYVHDVSGCETVDPHRIARHQCWKHVNGMVLVVDPFGLPAVRRKYGQAIQSLRPPIEPTSQAFSGEHLAAVIQAMTAYRVPRRRGHWNVSVAVVVTKLDALGLIRNFGSEPGSTLESVDTACRNHLMQWGFGNMIREFELRFDKVRYFANGSQGRDAFSPANPLRWLHGA